MEWSPRLHASGASANELGISGGGSDRNKDYEINSDDFGITREELGRMNYLRGDGQKFTCFR